MGHYYEHIGIRSTAYNYFSKAKIGLKETDREIINFIDDYLRTYAPLNKV